MREAMGAGRLTHTVEEAGEILGIGRAAAYRAAKRGDLPTIRIGRRLLVPRHRLERLLGIHEEPIDFDVLGSALLAVPEEPDDDYPA